MQIISARTRQINFLLLMLIFPLELISCRFFLDVSIGLYRVPFQHKVLSNYIKTLVRYKKIIWVVIYKKVTQIFFKNFYLINQHSSSQLISSLKHHKYQNYRYPQKSWKHFLLKKLNIFYFVNYWYISKDPIFILVLQNFKTWF